ncbi:MAG: class I SAM-dependent methyltransferase [Armatimonadetes bacterium]|nr:MAG: class I SAM-dependent methyltransferase [Armatimonadota bacterium]
MSDDSPADDEATIEYFERHVHDYGPRRFRFALDQIRNHVTPETALIDVGCGTGTLLELLASETGIVDLTGVDVSANALAVAAGRVTCETFQVSILAPDLAASIPRRYDFVVMAAVLHHLVGPSRVRSREIAAAALQQAVELMTNDGHLVIVEPTFTPHWAMSLVFFVKKRVTLLTSRRIEILGRWNNIGAPVVSYYSPDELCDLVSEAGAEVVELHNVKSRLRLLPKLLGISGRWETTLIARRISR